jgi:hypothetical protein
LLDFYLPVRNFCLGRVQYKTLTSNFEDSFMAMRQIALPAQEPLLDLVDFFNSVILFGFFTTTCIFLRRKYRAIYHFKRKIYNHTIN